MQDAQRIHEQVDEMRLRAEVRGAVSEDHANIVAERRRAVERDLARWKALRDGFVLAEQVLGQRRAQAAQMQPPPSVVVLEGYQGALDEFGRLREQTRDMIAKNEGALAALGGLEEAFRHLHAEAVARVRGLDVQGERAEAVAESREPANSEQLAVSGEIPAKEPISASELEASGSRRSRRKPEPR